MRGLWSAKVESSGRGGDLGGRRLINEPAVHAVAVRLVASASTCDGMPRRRRRRKSHLRTGGWAIEERAGSLAVAGGGGGRHGCERGAVSGTCQHLSRLSQRGAGACGVMLRSFEVPRSHSDRRVFLFVGRGSIVVRVSEQARERERRGGGFTTEDWH